MLEASEEMLMRAISALGRCEKSSTVASGRAILREHKLASAFTRHRVNSTFIRVSTER